MLAALGPWTFPPFTYPLVMLTSLAVGIFLARQSQTPLGLSTGQRWAIGLGAFTGAMLGAKLPWLIYEAAVHGPWTWFASGKTILSGLAGGYLGVEAAKWIFQIRVKTGDTFAVPVAASIAIGRLGCFVAGCCHGLPTTLPWGIDFGDGPRHPAQLYEVAFHALAAVVLSILARRGYWPRHRFQLYVIAYGAYRMISETWRPEPRLWLGATGYQWGALGIILLMASLWWLDERGTPSELARTRREIA